MLPAARSSRESGAGSASPGRIEHPNAKITDFGESSKGVLAFSSDLGKAGKERRFTNRRVMRAVWKAPLLGVHSQRIRRTRSNGPGGRRSVVAPSVTWAMTEHRPPT